MPKQSKHQRRSKKRWRIPFCLGLALIALALLWFARHFGFFRHGTPDSAPSTTAKSAIATNQNTYLAENALGREAKQRGDTNQALAHFNESLRIQNNPEAHHSLGNLLLAQKKTDDAIAHFRAALRLESRLPSTHNSLATALSDQGKADEAIVHYQEAIRLQPETAAFHYNLAVVFADQKNDASASLEFAQAERLGFESDDLALTFGKVLNRLGQFDEAEPHLRQALAAKTNSFEASFQFALSLDRQNKHGEAIAAYGHALTQMPDNPETLNHLALIYLTTPLTDLRSPKMALLLATRACAAGNYDNPFHLDTLAQSCAADHDLPAAIRWEQRAIESVPSTGDKHFMEDLRARLVLYQAQKSSLKTNK